MKYREIRITEKAGKDIKSIYYYIFKDSNKHAELFVEEIIKEIDNLIYFPNKGRKISENEKNYREIFVGNYRVIYFLIDCEIIVLRIIHMSLDYNLKIENNI